MLEFNKWFFYLLINFLVLIYVLNIILFKPMLRLFSEREDTIKGSVDTVAQLNKRKDDAVTAMNHELKTAIGKANELFETIRKEGLERQKEILEGANKQSLDLVGKAKAELKVESDKARQQLRADVEKFSDEIVRKLVGA